MELEHCDKAFITIHNFIIFSLLETCVGSHIVSNDRNMEFHVISSI